jgi:hypothetical protein
MIDADEAFEREVFAMRAVPPMSLDVDDVFARANRIARSHAHARSKPRAPWAAWIAAAACLFGVVQAHQVRRASDSIVPRSAEVSDGLTCRADVAEVVASDDGMCVARPSELVCARDVTFSSVAP